MSQATREIELADPITYMRLHNEAVLTRDPLGELPYTDEKIDNTIEGTNPYAYPQTDWRDMLLKDYTMNQRLNMNVRSEEHTSELQSLMRNSYAVFCLKK